jgi:arsenate reductase (thioredoxin)
MTADENKKPYVLFLCTGNSCRSQMAEGWARHLKSDAIEAFSAGVYPVGVSQRAAKVMLEAGVDISDQRSKHVDDLCGLEFDYVVTLCGNAAEQCPAFAGKTKTVHMPVRDPSFLIGSEEAILDAFRKTRDEIRELVEKMPESLEEAASSR